MKDFEKSWKLRLQLDFPHRHKVTYPDRTCGIQLCNLRTENHIFMSHYLKVSLNNTKKQVSTLLHFNFDFFFRQSTVDFFYSTVLHTDEKNDFYKLCCLLIQSSCLPIQKQTNKPTKTYCAARLLGDSDCRSSSPHKCVVLSEPPKEVTFSISLKDLFF